MKQYETDFLIIGSGTAGLTLALKLADHGSVTILAKDKAPAANSAMAQGGIASVAAAEDDFNSHIQDTIIAGAGLCDETVVDNYITQAPERIKELQNWGVQFDPHLTREGGHSFRRIFHVEDQTGKAIHDALLQNVLKNKNVHLLEEHFAIDLVSNKKLNPKDMSPQKIVGCYSLHRATNQVHRIKAKTTILATGGAGKVYLYTSNWSGATGDGIAMAFRAGARVANLEFMQFHPTCLYHPQARNFLISEALRGEGGELVNSHGHAFMKKYHPLGSLAPRDIVARSIDAEMKKTGEDCVYLDMTKQSEDFLKSHFPAIYQKCIEFGIDMAKQPIPVVPAAHYLCGGVLTDENGQTDILGLYAIGETACTGLHGANRLASNSLLECVAMAHNCAEVIIKNKSQLKHIDSDLNEWIHPSITNEDEMIVIRHMWDEIRHLMWNYVGIVRTNKRLLRAQSRLKNILNEVRDYYSNMQLHPDILELRNIAIVADLSIECAILRKESRGIHFNLDYPPQTHGELDNPTDGVTARNTILVRGKV